jgi:hypothetical protein
MQSDGKRNNYLEIRGTSSLGELYKALYGFRDIVITCNSHLSFWPFDYLLITERKVDYGVMDVVLGDCRLCVCAHCRSNSSKRATLAMLLRRANPVVSRPRRRAFATVLSSSSMFSARRSRLSFSAARNTFRMVHLRAISYSALPRFVARAFRVPIAGATVGAGALGYANYQFEGK